GFDIEICSSVDEAVLGADVITVCTADKQHATVLHDAQVVPGVHLNGIGGDCPGKTELEARILDRSTVFVEFEPQSRIEGEIQQMAPDFPVVEFADVVRGIHPGRTSDDEITLFDSVGFAMSDFSALRYVRDSVAGTHYFDRIELIAEPDDPKDLFSLIVPSLKPVS
ncbi:MAG: ornithine cyclodeaminase, partial [Trueperella sp.]|nr:ornithine cyclodeaminase [Trueperella sp.]